MLKMPTTNNSKGTSMITMIRVLRRLILKRMRTTGRQRRKRVTHAEILDVSAADSKITGFPHRDV